MKLKTYVCLSQCVPELKGKQKKHNGDDDQYEYESSAKLQSKIEPTIIKKLTQI